MYDCWEFVENDDQHGVLSEYTSPPTSFHDLGPRSLRSVKGV